MKIIACNSTRPLGESIASHLKVPLIQASFHRYADREILVDLQESVRGQDVFVIQSTSNPANDTLMELLVTIDALRRSSARTITAVIPYLGYGRQDRKHTLRSSMGAKLVANLITVSGANRVLTVDWHSNQIQGFFDIPTDNVTVAPLFCQAIREDYGDAIPMIVSPDVGGLARARYMAEHLGADLAVIDKRRTGLGKATSMNGMGDVKGRSCVLIDDMVDSAGTLCKAAQTLKEAGASSVDAYISHGILSGNALENIGLSSLRKLVVSDTILPSLETQQASKIDVLTVSSLLANAIDRIANNQSISNLFELPTQKVVEMRKSKDIG